MRNTVSHPATLCITPLAGQLTALESRQDGLAKAAQAFVASLKAVTAQGEALGVEAGKSLKAKAEEARQAELEKARARVAELEAKQPQG